MAFIRRDQWGARPPRSRQSFNPWGVAVHYVDQTVGPMSHEGCYNLVRSIQNMHMAPGGLGASSGGSDIAYNMLVCRHGDIFEGRGVGIRTGANGTGAANSSHFAICYLGGGEEPPAAALRGINEAAAMAGLRNAPWSGHRDHYSTSCPGNWLHNWVRRGHPSDGAPSEPERPRYDQVFSKSPHPVTRFIRSVVSEKVIDISGAGDSANNANNIALYPIDGQKDQRWKLYGYPNNEVAFVSMASDVAIDTPDKHRELWVWQHTGDNRNQRFRLVRLGYNLCVVQHVDSGNVLTAEGDNIVLAPRRNIEGTDSPIPEQVWDFIQSI